MLAAVVPVIAYDAPGPHTMLPREFRVGVRDDAAIIAKVVELLADPTRLRAAHRWAGARAADFRWEEIAARTAEAYLGRLARSGELLR
jgi:glycosyltransferase involved in cell wall biosynthesis